MASDEQKPINLESYGKKRSSKCYMVCTCICEWVLSMCIHRYMYAFLCVFDDINLYCFCCIDFYCPQTPIIDLLRNWMLLARLEIYDNWHLGEDNKFGD